MTRTQTHPIRLRWAIGLVVLGLLAVLLPTQRAAADHTPIPTAVALVGSLQSELGCPGDWQPECTATHLEPVPGQPEVFRATFTVPAGSYEYKVALNNSWDENYGAGGAAGGANLPITSTGDPITFTYDHRTHVISDDTPRPLIADAAAHWLGRGTIAWDLPDSRDGFSYRLYWAAEGGLAEEDGEIVGGESVPLTVVAGGLPADLRAQFPHLAAYEALSVPAGARSQIAGILTAQIAVASFTREGELSAVTAVQIPGVLDEVYAGARTRTLGPIWRGGRPSLTLWAPTAKNVVLLLTRAGSSTEQRVAMTRDRDGVWSVRGSSAWRNARYRFEVRVYAPTTSAVETNLVTDPYSLGLTTNSARSILVDLDDPALEPAGWNRLRKPALPKPEYSTIYELHVRDFSISDETVPATHRGTYLAFTDRGSDGMRHLRQLARSGLNTVHLLPVNDIASIEEDRAAQLTPDCDLESFPPDSEAAAGLRHRGRRTGRVQLGLRPAALHRTGGLVRDRSFRDGAQPAVPRDGRRPERGRASER